MTFAFTHREPTFYYLAALLIGFRADTYPMKLILNRCYGGFTLSDDQVALLGVEHEHIFEDSLRTDQRLIASVEAGDKGGIYAALEVLEIPDGCHYKIFDYDGYETVIYSDSPISEK